MTRLRTHRSRLRPVLLALSMLIGFTGIAAASSPAANAAAAGCDVPAGETLEKFTNVNNVYSYISVVGTTPAFDLAFPPKPSINNTDLVGSAKFTATESKAFTTSITNGVSVPLAIKKFKFTVNSSVTASFASSTGTTTEVTYPVPPRTKLLASYGTEAIDIAFDLHSYYIHPLAGCRYMGATRNTSHTVTTGEGWRTDKFPL